MTAETQSTSIPAAMLWTGGILTGLLVLFLAFDAFGKIVRVAPVVEGSAKLGVGEHVLLGLGVLLLACTVIYSIPRTAVLGAILLTGYLGGAAAIHLRAGSGWFPMVFSVGFGVLVWLGLILRDPRLLWTILLRQ